MEKLKQDIINLCNESGLPLEAMLFVTKDVWRDVEATLRAAQASVAQTEKAQTTNLQEEKK